MSNAITEIKNTLERTNSRGTESVDWISELEDRMVETTEAEWNKWKRIKINESSIRDLWENIKHTGIRTVGILE